MFGTFARSVRRLTGTVLRPLARLARRAMKTFTELWRGHQKRLITGTTYTSVLLGVVAYLLGQLSLEGLLALIVGALNTDLHDGYQPSFA